jgi:hypothetical protein
MHDRPTAAELVEAVRGYLETELLPALTDARQRFQALVAANVLAIAGRELATEETALREEAGLLKDVLETPDEAPARLAELRAAVVEANRRLCARIRAGAFDEMARFAPLATVLRRLVMRKLEVANPRYLAAWAVSGGRGASAPDSATH